MSAREVNGVMYLDKPLTVDYLDFLYEHIGCDVLITKESAKNEETNDVIAYAVDKMYNPKLRSVFKTKYNNGAYMILHHISEEEADGIF